MNIFPVVVKRTSAPAAPTGDPFNGGFIEAVAFGIIVPEAIAAPLDAIAIALTVPDTIAGQTETVKLGLLGLGDSNLAPAEGFSLGIKAAEVANPAPADAALFSFAFTLAETNPEFSETLKAALSGSAFADTNLTPSELITLALSGAGFADTNAALAETINLALSGAALADTIAAQSETVKAALSGTAFADSNLAPSEVRTSVARFWLSGSTSGSGITNPANADGPTTTGAAVITTVALGSNPAIMTSNVGNGIPAATSFTSAIYRGWFKYDETLTTSDGRLKAIYSGGTITMLAMTVNVDHTNGTFTFDLIAAGINTLAKLQSMTVTHETQDVTAGLTPAVLSIFAGAIELTGII